MYVYVSPPSEELICPVCHDAFVDPIALPCGCTICRHCLRTPNCPSCGKPIRMSADAMPPPHRIVLTMLDKLVVRCPHAACEATMPRGAMAAHALTCGNAPKSRAACEVCKAVIGPEGLLRHFVTAHAPSDVMRAALLSEMAALEGKGSQHAGRLVGEHVPEMAHWTCCLRPADAVGCL